LRACGLSELIKTLNFAMIEFLKRLFRPRRAAEVRPVADRAGAAGNREASVAADARRVWAEQASRPIDPKAAPEDLCGITPGMSSDEIARRLTDLHRRHNRAATSLDAQLRAESDIMLDAIAALREKYFP
jgi:hypothetical protein